MDNRYRTLGRARLAVALLSSAAVVGCGDDSGPAQYQGGPATGGDGGGLSTGPDGGPPGTGGTGAAGGTGATGGGTMPDAGGGPPPVDPGELYASCAGDDACASGICAEVEGVRLCSKSCSDNAECPAAPGSSVLPYCAPLDGVDVCALACPGGAACPDGMRCENAVCLPLSDWWSPCSSDDDCVEGIECGGTSRFCRGACAADTDCPMPITGDAVPMCGSAGTCVLPCPGGSSCPVGTACDGAYCLRG